MGTGQDVSPKSCACGLRVALLDSLDGVTYSGVTQADRRFTEFSLRL